MADDNTALLLDVNASLNKLIRSWEKGVGDVDKNATAIERRSQAMADKINKLSANVRVGADPAQAVARLNLENQIAVARASGNAAEAQALTIQLGVMDQIVRLKGLGVEATEAQAQAEAHGLALSLAAEASQAAVTASRAQRLKIESEITIARSAGNKEEVAELGEQLALLTQIDKLRALGLTETEAQAQAEAHVLAIQAAQVRARGANVGLALEEVLESSRLKVFEEGAARVSVFGGALEALGPIGLGTAAALGALYVTMEKTDKAVEAAAGFAKLAKEVGVTTDFIQEFNFVAKQSEVDVGQADEGLKQLNASFGAVIGNLPRSKQLLVEFKDALGISADELRGYHDIGELLPVLIEKFGEIKNAGERAAIAQKLGFGDLIPVINQGIEKYRELTARARELGVVMDASTIRKAAEAKEKLNELNQVMEAKTNITFAQFAGTLIKVRTAFDEARLAGLRFLADITGTTPARDVIVEQTARLIALKGVEARQGFRPLGADSEYRDITAKLRKATAELNQEKADNAASSGASGQGTQLVATKEPKGKKEKSDDSVARGESAETALAEATKALAEARKALTKDVEKQAAFEITANNAEAAAKQARLGKEKADLLKDQAIEGPASDIIQAKIEQAQADVEAARMAKETLIKRNAELALSDEQYATEKQISDYYSQLAGIQSQLALTAAERLAIDRRDLILRQRLEREALANLNSRDIAEHPDDGGAALSRSEARTSSLNDLQAGQRQQLERGSEPAKAADSIVAGIKKQGSAADDAAAEYAEIDRLRQADKVSEAEAVQAKAQINAAYSEQRLINTRAFFGNLAQLSQSSNHTLAAIGKAAAIAQATIDGVLAVQKALASAPPPFSFVLAAAAGAAAAVNVAKIAGLKDGGEVTGVGGPRDDNQLRRLSVGEHVINAPAANVNRPVLEAINAGVDVRALLAARRFSAPSLPTLGGPAAINLSVHVDAGGAITQDAIEGMVHSGVATGMAQARALAANDTRTGVVPVLRSQQKLAG